MSGTTEADSLSGCDLDGRPSRWKLINREEIHLPGSRLRTCRVQTTDGATLVLRSPYAAGDENSRMLLDNEIRALARLTRAFPDRRPRPFPALAGYAMDTLEPWALFHDYLGVPAREVTDRLLGADQRDFMVNVFDALAHLSLVEVVHGQLSLDSIRLDGDRIQLVLFEDAALVGEPDRRRGGRVTPETDARAAGCLLYEAFTGTRPAGRPDLAEIPLLASRLGDLFTASGPVPEATEVLRRLGREDFPRIEGVDELEAGRAAFDVARERKRPKPQPVPAPPAPPRRSSRVVVTLLSTAALLLVAVVWLVLIGVSA
ncbi:hypothetical protein ACFVYA_18315 [Amycolatopsis sp. NPDC058278]|uniref:hypothetical protein n=1 Tax=Amycolatopsis sp. NPDC058278 TaxID=3346417 RepID=UPI0036D856C7